MVSGASAGGIGAFAHADYVRALPALQGADVRAAPYCGWFFPDVASWPAWQKNRTAGTDWERASGLNKIWSDAGGECYADASCRDAMPAGEAFKCNTIDVLYGHIETPLFVSENQYDEEQTFARMLNTGGPSYCHTCIICIKFVLID